MPADGSSYRAVLRAPHVARPFAASVVGRLSLATSGLALVLLLAQTSGSFAVGGAVIAAIGIANVVATPWRARLIDRRGQVLVLSALASGHATSLIALGLVAHEGLPLLLSLSVVVGVTAPPFAASMRVLLSDVLPPGGLRTRGLSLDAVAGEVTFAAGPLLAALLAVISSPFAALTLSAACVAIGAAAFVSSPLSRRHPGSRGTTPAAPAPSPLRTRGFAPVVFAMVAPGAVLGAVEIAAPALATAASNTVLAGILLALFAGASAASGLLYGRFQRRRDIERRLPVMTSTLVAVVAATGIVGGPAAAMVGFALGGLCLAPALIIGYLAANERTDVRVRTEANAWIDTAVNLGAALGAAVFGALTVSAPPGPALALSALVPAVVIALAAPFLLRSPRSRGRGDD